MKIMKKFLSIMAILLLIGAAGLAFEMEAHAEETKTVIALGADLSAEQKATVLGLMGITEEQLAGCEVMTRNTNIWIHILGLPLSEASPFPALC